MSTTYLAYDYDAAAAAAAAGDGNDDDDYGPLTDRYLYVGEWACVSQ